MKRTLCAIMLGIGLALTGCASTGSGPAPTAQAQVFALESTYVAAENLATIYASLPACPAASVCSQPAIKVKLKQARDVARAALGQAESAVRDPAFSAGEASAVLTAANAAIIALNTIVATLTVK